MNPRKMRRSPVLPGDTAVVLPTTPITYAPPWPLLGHHFPGQPVLAALIAGAALRSRRMQPRVGGGGAGPAPREGAQDGERCAGSGDSSGSGPAEGSGRGAAGGRGSGGDTCPAAGPPRPSPLLPSAGTAGAPAPPGCRLGVPSRPVPARERGVPAGPVTAAGAASPPGSRHPPRRGGRRRRSSAGPRAVPRPWGWSRGLRRGGAAPSALRGAATETRAAAGAFPRPGRRRLPPPAPRRLLPGLFLCRPRGCRPPGAARAGLGWASSRPWLATSPPAPISTPRSRSTCKPTKMS